MSIEFKNLQLIIDDQDPTEEYLEFIDNSINKIMKIDDWIYNFHTEYNSEDKYLWIYAEFNNSKLHNEKVYNEDKQCDEPNPRLTNQIEMNKQFFFIYFLDAKVLYLSNVQKKGHLKYYLSDILQKKVEFKNYYKNIEEFSKGISSLKSISFVTKDTLFRKDNGIFDAVNNIYGLDYANSIRINIDYGKQPFSNIKHNFLSKIGKEEKNSQIENIVVCGYDDDQIEKRLNVNNYIESINIAVDTDNTTGMYREDDVKNAIIKKLKEKNYV